MDSQHFQTEKTILNHCKKPGSLTCPQLSSLCFQKQSWIHSPVPHCRLHPIASPHGNSVFIKNIPLCGCSFFLSATLLWSNPTLAFLPSHCHEAAFIPGRITEAFPPPCGIPAQGLPQASHCVGLCTAARRSSQYMLRVILSASGMNYFIAASLSEKSA